MWSELGMSRMVRILTRLIVAVPMVYGVGCHSGYHAYECGCPPIEYCRRPPLPVWPYPHGCPAPLRTWSSTPEACGLPNSAATQPPRLTDAPCAPEPADADRSTAKSLGGA